MPRGSLDEVLHPVLAGVLAAADITAAGETVERTFRFSELTLVVTSQRLVKHVGAAVWDEEFEEYPYGTVTDVDFEEGSVSTSIVLTVDGRQERFKTPTDETRAVREALTEGLLDHYDVRTLSAFREAAAPEPEPEPNAEPTAETTDDDGVGFGSGPDPLSADPAEVEEPTNATREGTGGDAAAAIAGVEEGFDDASESGDGTVTEVATATDAGPEGNGSFAGSGFESATPEEDLVEEVTQLRETVRRQREEIERNGELIEKLIEELRRGR